MLLKSIEIRGFKSFADCTELVFQEGITAIVGPNGSGKSNIYDAIRWCLGEQSVKSLRGIKMEDVIFSGTQYRKSISLAQVTLTIDNSKRELPIDYSTLSVSRKLYRSGESEYLINNKVCKLKDVHELFFDTGVGKEGYSLIGQGKIEAILSGNASDRRTIIEEAVGITKYKFKKEEAKNKINNANENLVRINDILTTYYEYLEPLYIEQDKAKKFLKISEELKEIEVSLIKSKLYKIGLNVSDVKGHIEKYQNKYDLVNTYKINLEKDLEKHQNSLEQLNLEEKQKRDEYYKIKDEVQIYTNELNLAENNILMLKDSDNIYRKQKEENSFKIENLESKSDIISMTKLDLQKEFDKLENYLNSFKDYFDSKNKEINNLNDELANIKNHESKFIEDTNTIKNNIEFLKLKINSLEDEKNNLTNEKDILDKKVLDIGNEIESQEYEREIKYQELVNKQNLYSNIINGNKENSLKIQSLREKINFINQEVAVKKSNLNMLIQYENEYDGFNKASKKLMNEINNNTFPKWKNKCFIVGGIFNTKQEYELAIETAIGGHISDIITEDDTIVKNIIEYLKKNNLGRITFHPLNIIKEFNFNNKDQLLVSKKGFINYAINLVNVEERFMKVAKNILGKTIICDNLENGINLAKDIKFTSKIITLDSQIINSGGSITGGSSFNKTFGLIGRKRKIKETEEILNSKKLEIEKLQQELINCENTEKQAEKEINNLESNIQNIKDALLKIDNELILKNQFKERELSDFSKKNNLLNNIDNLILDHNNKINELNNELETNNSSNEKIKLNMENIYFQLEDLNKQIKQEEDKITEDRIRKGKLEENLISIDQEINRITMEKKDLILANENIQKEIDTIITKINTYDLSIQELKEKIDNFLKVNIENEKTFNGYTIKQSELRNKIKEINTYIDEEKYKLNEINTNINSLNIRLVKTESEFNILNDKLLNEYEVYFEHSENEDLYLTDREIEKYNKKVQMLKADISELGTINIKSIEEYNSLNEKVEFMKKQKEDLDKSKQELIQFIEQITVEMRQIFNENFKIINENFNKTFKELFKGGTANLSLGEGDELECTIDIIVQPPGKKLQNLNLLSGGEKGLSAISLLFAILQMKPVSFCILDEIEAALDDSNVLRFSEFLKTLSKTIQFIVITHRKITMEASDIIYGVTMQEKGISKIVSINLANYNI